MSFGENMNCQSQCILIYIHLSILCHQCYGLHIVILADGFIDRVLNSLVLLYRQLEEMIRCPDCYLMSNTRSKNWFCKPCVSMEGK